MSAMAYITPGLTRIDFEDNLFVTTELDKDTNKEVKECIESKGGIIKSSVTKSTNYLIYEDGKEETTKYKKALELVQEKSLDINILPMSLFNIMRKGKELVEFGSYPFYADGVKKPIKWLILKRDDKKALLLSAYTLDAKPYNEKLIDINWERCTLRKWLNEDFYNTAFMEEEKAKIQLTKLKNDDNPKYKTPGGNDTEDKVFLLSIGEVNQYLLTESERMVTPSHYAVKQGVCQGYTKNWWWLRSPGRGPVYAANISSKGYVSDSGNGVRYDNGGTVCPALWIDLESEF